MYVDAKLLLESEGGLREECCGYSKTDRNPRVAHALQTRLFNKGSMAALAQCFALQSFLDHRCFRMFFQHCKALMVEDLVTASAIVGLSIDATFPVTLSASLPVLKSFSIIASRGI